MVSAQTLAVSRSPHLGLITADASCSRLPTPIGNLHLIVMAKPAAKPAKSQRSLYDDPRLGEGALAALRRRGFSEIDIKNALASVKPEPGSIPTEG